jgi:predicted DNA-binding transcriptional regulator AlpA
MTDKPDRFISIAEVAEMLGIPVKELALYKTKTRDLPRIKLGSRVVFSLKAVEKWIEERKDTKDESKTEPEDNR